MKFLLLNTQLAVLPQENSSGGQGETEENPFDDEVTEDTEEGGQKGDGEDTDDDTEGEGANGEDENEGDETNQENEGDETGEAADENDGDDEGTGNGEDTDGDDDAETGETEGDNGNPGDGETGDDGEADGDDPDGINENPSDIGQEGDGNEPEGKDGDTGNEITDLTGRDPIESENHDTAGGGEYVEKDDKAQQEAMAEMLEQLLEQMDEGQYGNGEAPETDLKDNNSAMAEHFEGLGGDCLEGEQLWNPYCPELDVVAPVKGGNKETALKYQKKVKPLIASLAAKLRSKFLQARKPVVRHGVRRGRELSERRLVDSVVELRSGRRPTRPDWDRTNKPECSLAVSVVIDQSGSMSGEMQRGATLGALAIATPLDKLGAPVQVIGPRNGYNCGKYAGSVMTNDEYYAAQNEIHNGYYNQDAKQKFHRLDGVRIDIFKNWEESMVKALPRFSQITATGSTPLSDGIQYAMQELNERTETHRVILVLTDGAPDCEGVVKRQIRIAREAGVHIIGIGIGCGSYYVPQCFPDKHVCVEDIKDLPTELLGALDSIMFPKRTKKMNIKKMGA